MLTMLCRILLLSAIVTEIRLPAYNTADFLLELNSSYRVEAAINDGTLFMYPLETIKIVYFL